ncbi:hypothetical protein SK128_018509 [Halocaridina rubra]|uniref:G-protein coupled receptors family 1 profile domain-containing protein n=1 Tax=Halocaridina rubra TaxID=373956 RepID=A0AAN8WMX5_HALRR
MKLKFSVLDNRATPIHEKGSFFSINKEFEISDTWKMSSSLFSPAATPPTHPLGSFHKTLESPLDLPSASHFISSRGSGLETADNLFAFESVVVPSTPFLETAANDTMTSELENLNDSRILNGKLGKVMPQDMMFNESHIITISAYSCLMVLSALGNISVLRSIARHKTRTSTSRVSLMIMHLAIADLLVTVLLMPLEIGWAWTVSWEAGDLACRVMAFFRTFGVFLSGFLLVVISIDRYHAVLRPLTVTEAKRRVRLMLWLAWGASVACSIPQEQGAEF